MLQPCIPRGGGDTVVIGQETARLRANCFGNSLIYFAARLQEGPDIALKQPTMMFVVEFCKQLPGQHGHQAPVPVHLL